MFQKEMIDTKQNQELNNLNRYCETIQFKEGSLKNLNHNSLTKYLYYANIYNIFNFIKIFLG